MGGIAPVSKVLGPSVVDRAVSAAVYLFSNQSDVNVSKCRFVDEKRIYGVQPACCEASKDIGLYSMRPRRFDRAASAWNSHTFSTQIEHVFLFESFGSVQSLRLIEPPRTNAACNATQLMAVMTERLGMVIDELGWLEC